MAITFSDVATARGLALFARWVARSPRQNASSIWWWECVTICNSLEHLRFLQTKGSQSGKFITIYPQNEFHAYEIAQEVENVLVKFPSTFFNKPPFEIPVGNSGGLSARYGVLQGFDTMDFAINGQNFSVKDIREGRPWPYTVARHPFRDMIPDRVWREYEDKFPKTLYWDEALAEYREFIEDYHRSNAPVRVATTQTRAVHPYFDGPADAAYRAAHDAALVLGAVTDEDLLAMAIAASLRTHSPS